jgi:hypothetical protein
VHQPRRLRRRVGGANVHVGQFASRESAQCIVAIGIDTTVSTSPRSRTPLPHHAVLHVEHELALDEEVIGGTTRRRVLDTDAVPAVSC